MAGLVGEEALVFAKSFWKGLTSGKGFAKYLGEVKIISAGEGACEAEFEVTEDTSNKLGTLHGGYTATIIDCITTVGLTTSKQQKPGSTVNLSINYTKAGKIGDKIVVEAKTIKIGKTLAFLEAVLKEKKTNAVLATGSHVKYIG